MGFIGKRRGLVRFFKNFNKFNNIYYEGLNSIKFNFKLKVFIGKN